MLRLSALNPTLHETGTLEFDCPAAHPHRVFARIAADGWSAEGEFPESITVRPSILPRTGRPNDESLATAVDKEAYDAAAKCGWHGFITNGEVTTC